jgi:hypothetical protein
MSRTIESAGTGKVAVATLLDKGLWRAPLVIERTHLMKTLGSLMPDFEWKFDGGHIITILVLIIGMAITWGASSNKLDANAEALTEVKSQILRLQEKLDSVRDEQVKNSTILAEQQEAERERQRREK